MIKVKYIPSRFEKKNVVEKECRFLRSERLWHYVIKVKLMPQSDFDKYDFIISGRVAQGPDEYVNDKDEIIITPKIKAPVIAFIASSVATVATALGASAATAVAINSATIFALTAITAVGFVASIGFSLYSAFQKPQQPNFGSLSAGGIDEGSPTYSWDGIRTTRDINIPVGIIYGEHKVGGNVINEFVTTDGDSNTLHSLLALGEGEIESITDVKINDNPIDNFQGITTVTRMGTNNQTSIPNFEDLHNVVPINTQIVNGTPYIYTTADSDVEAFEIDVRFPGGLYQVDDTTGEIISWSVDIKVSYKKHSAGAYTVEGTHTFSGKSRSSLRRVIRVEGLDADQYDIKIERTSDNSSLDPQKNGDSYLQAIDEIKTDNLSYPNTALLAVHSLATNQLSGASPSYSAVVRGRKVSIPQVQLTGDDVPWEDYYYDPDDDKFKLLADDTELDWDGTSYIEAWSANPVWCLKDLMTNTRYGIGEFIDASLIPDEWYLQEAKHCEERIGDGNGGFEKRYRLDVVIDSQNRALDLLMQLTSAFNAFLFYSGGTLKIIIDRPGTPVQQFGMGNIIKDSFQQTWTTLRDAPNYIEIQYLDKDKDYQQETIAVIDEADLAANKPMRKRSMRVYTTRTSQALRIGRFAKNVAKYVARVVTFKAAVDAIACQIGDLISFSHDVPAWGDSGRVRTGSTTTSIVLDKSVTIETGKTYTLQIRFADDTIEERTVSSAVGTHSTLSVSSAFSQAPADYDLFSFGESNIQTKPFRVVNMVVDEKSEVEITAIEYNANIYDDSDVVLPDNNYSALSVEVPAVDDLQLLSGIALLADGTIANVIHVFFTPPDSTGHYVMYRSAKIFISDNDGVSWDLAGETTGNSFTINKNLVDGTAYKVAVSSVNANGIALPIAASTQASLTLAGKSAPPADVTGFLLNQSRDKLVFSWTKVDDLDLSGYEIRYGDTWEAGTPIAKQIKITRYTEVNFKEGNAQKYWIKAVDTSGNYSTTATEALVTVDSIPFTNIIDQYAEETAWSGTKSDLSKVGDNLEIDTGLLSGTYTTPVRDVGYVANFKIGVESVVVDATSNDAEFDDDLTREFDDDETSRFSGEEVVGAIAIEIRTSEDNITWTAWKTWQAGDYKCRYFQLKFTLSRSDTSKIIQCSVFNYYADLPDVDDKGTATISVAASGVSVTFNKTFHEAPSVNVDIISGSGVVHKFTVAPTTTGFTVKLYDLSAVAQTGDIRWHAHGV